MYPRADGELDPELPDAAEFWTPEPDDIDEEGIGYFRDVWAIVDIAEEEARDMVHKDRTVSALVGELASTEAEFDVMAKVIETGERGYAEHLAADKRAALSPYMTEDEDDPVPLDGLEVGVAGLVYALSAAGAYPAASCRGHPDDHAWSTVPAVFLAIDRCRARVLAPLVRDTGCGFDIDPARHQLLVVCSASIEGTISLAEAIVSKLPAFRACDRDNDAEPEPLVQPTFFDDEM